MKQISPVGRARASPARSVPFRFIPRNNPFQSETRVPCQFEKNQQTYEYVLFLLLLFIKQNHQMEIH